MELVSHALVVAIFTLFWEVILRDPVLALISKLKYREIRKNIMKFSGEVYISKSIPESIKPVARLSDVEIEKWLEKDIDNNILIKDEPVVDIDNPSVNLIILGSTRYNKHAQEIQKRISPQFEYIFDLIEGDPDRHILRLVNKYGDIYFSSVDLDHFDEDFAIDYGILLHAKLKNNKRVLWISGIHGAATIGVFKYFRENPFFFTDKFLHNEFISFLFRVKYDKKYKNESLAMIKEVEIISTSDSCKFRLHKKPSVIICDFGNVIMSFDRNRTYRAIAHWIQRPFEDIKVVFENNSNIRNEYENGNMSDDEFYKKFLGLLNVTSEKLSFDIFKEFWGDIFWPDTRVMKLLKSLKSEFKLVLLSNTNNMHFADVREHYSDFIDLFEGRLILSYEAKLSKPDTEIFYKAINSATPNTIASDCIYIDDKSDYVDVAKKLGMNGIVYNSYAQLVYQLRSNGVYSDVIFS